MDYCRNCGSVLPAEETNFCPKCGCTTPEYDTKIQSINKAPIKTSKSNKTLGIVVLFLGAVIAIIMFASFLLDHRESIIYCESETYDAEQCAQKNNRKYVFLALSVTSAIFAQWGIFQIRRSIFL